MASISLQKLIDKTKLVNLTPNIDTTKIKVTMPDINRPALQLAGYFEHFDSTRVQVIGFVEYTYLEEVADERKREIYEQLLSYEVPAVVFSRELEPDDIFLEVANKHGVPVLSTKASTSSFMANMNK